MQHSAMLFSWRVGEALGVQAMRPAKVASEGVEAPKGCEVGQALRMVNSGALVALWWHLRACCA